jgi:CheY-like chemotaxis protein
MRVLFIEDSPDFARGMSLLMERAGCDVVWASTGAEALRYASSEAFDVMISDLWLSDVDGLSLMPKLQARCACPAIALSGDFVTGQFERMHAAGFSSFARKPVDCDTLLLLIRRLAGPAKATAVDLAPKAKPRLPVAPLPPRRVASPAVIA